jgi:hypothetical protein
MHNILITKDIEYGVGDTSPVTTANLTTLETGSLAIVADNKRVLAADGSDAEGVQSFQFVVGITKKPGITVQNSVPIYTKYIEYINVEKYNDPVTQIVEIGPFTNAAGTAEGEIGLTLNNNSYIGTIQTEQLRINQWKKSSATLVSALQKIVDTINLGTGLPRPGQYQAFMTAALSGAGDASKIVLTMKTEHVAFSVSAYGLAEGVVVATTRQPVLSKGMGIDVRRSEDEHSGNLGNGGYGWRNDLYFSKPLEANPADKYDIISIQFTGMHDTPQNKVRAAANWIQIAIPTSSALTETVQTILANIAPDKYKPSQDQFNESDKDPAGAAGTDPV